AAEAATPVQFDPAQIERGQRVWGSVAGCGGCHGWAGNGEKSGPIQPGPSLREITLTADEIREVVQCGRPSTPMPYHDRGAYRDDRCYGVTREDLGDAMPSRGTVLSARDIDAVVA